MSALNNSALIGASGSTGYQISRSVRLRSSASAYFNRTFTTPTNAAKWTFNRWVKRGAIGARQSLFAAGTSGSSYANIEFKADDTIQFLSENSAVQFQLVTTQVFRDPSAWYNIHIIYDSANATSTDRIQLWINGVRVTAFSTATYPTTTPNNLFNTAIAHQIGVLGYGSVAYFDGYQTELNFIDGQALTPASFGETNLVTGVWQPKKYTGTYGTNGFYLNFSDNSSNTATTIGKDYSGNGNNWTPNNISVTAGVTYDSMLDVPTQWADGGNGRGNYAVLNPLLYMGSGSTKSNGNLKFAGGGTGGPPYNYSIYSTFTQNTGKWYWEVTITTAGSQPFVGMFNTAINFNGGSLVGSAGPVLYGYDGKYYNETTGVSFGNTYTTNDVIGVAVDYDNNLIWFSKNGTWQNSGDPSSGTNGKSFGSGKTWGTGYVESGSSASPSTFDANFGQRPFAYTPPTGFKALNTLNLPTPTILKGNQYFDATTYTGNGGTQSIVNAGGFQPDLVWVKARSVAYNNYLTDSVRGAGKELSSNLTDAESSFNLVSAFNSNGFTVFTNGTYLASNQNGTTYVGWQWKEGATQGFDIVLYTGNGAARTISHNLGVAPAMMIIKDRSAAGDNWIVWHKAFVTAGTSDYVLLNSTLAKGGGGAVDNWNNTPPTSSVFSLGTFVAVNRNADTYVAYLFAAVAGFSAFGSYTGNGSTDGPFVFCGFRPAFVMVKRTDTTGNWCVFDNRRLGYNGASASKELYPNLSNAEGTSNGPDQLSNGFKLRDTYTDVNASGGTYIFAAFAENPFKYSLAR